MPQVVVAIATAVSAAAANAAAAAGASSAVIEAVSSITYAAAAIGVASAPLVGIGVALTPKLPDPVAMQTPLKQPMPVRQSATGTVRVAGSYAFFGTGTGTASALSIDMLALLDGRSNAFVSYYLNDDLMAPVGDYWWAPGAPGKYGGGGSRSPNLVQIDSRLGLDTESSYSEIAPALPLWDASHRGDGVTSMALYCKPARREDQAGDFPNGLPTASAVIQAQLLYDPRDGAQTQGDESTYTWNDNPVLGLLGYLTDAKGGMGLDYARFILPAVDFWKAAADECDGLVSTSGMHATLLDAAATGDHKIFLADQTGLTAGTVIQLATETVTVSALGMVGEVDFTVPAALAYPHQAGELAYWNATGQQARYRCNALYRHDQPPGDVIKAYLSTFDGWLGQRGDGALIVRTNTVYEPAVVLSDRHIVGYQVQNGLPDEQVTNQYVVGYTDPASAYNKAEAGYVEDDDDIRDRGVVRSQELFLQWVPSGPQAVTVARALLARATQPVRGTITCNLAGLAPMGERYVGLEISEQPSLNGTIVEVTGKVSIDLQSMTASFPFVATGYRSNSTSQALCFVVDVSNDAVAATILPKTKTGLKNAISAILASIGGGIDLCVVGCGDTGTATSIVKRSMSSGDVVAVDAFIDALVVSPAYGFDISSAMTEAKVFFDGTDAGISARRIVLVWQGNSDPGATGSRPAQLAAAAAGGAILATMPGVLLNAINTVDPNPESSLYLDNTPDDGVPFAPGPDQVFSAIEQAVFGSTSTVGAGYSLPPLAPPSGAALQPLAAPTIISVTPDYADTGGGGVSGARLSIEVDDPGINASWKVQWKLSADTLWTLAGVSIDPDPGPPLSILSDFVAAAGVLDVQVAYVTASQQSDWSATTTVTVAASPGGVSSANKSANFTTTSANNCYFVDTSAVAVTVTLNATPGQDEVVEVWDSTGHAVANPISFAGNGHNIGGAANVASFIQINFGHARLIFDGIQWLMQ